MLREVFWRRAFRGANALDGRGDDLALPRSWLLVQAAAPWNNARILHSVRSDTALRRLPRDALLHGLEVAPMVDKAVNSGLSQRSAFSRDKVTRSTSPQPPKSVLVDKRQGRFAARRQSEWLVNTANVMSPGILQGLSRVDPPDSCQDAKALRGSFGGEGRLDRSRGSTARTTMECWDVGATTRLKGRRRIPSAVAPSWCLSRYVCCVSAKDTGWGRWTAARFAWSLVGGSSATSAALFRCSMLLPPSLLSHCSNPVAAGEDR